MKKLTGLSAFLLAGLIPLLISCNSGNNDGKTLSSDTAEKASHLKLQSTIELPNVKGGFDLMAVDIKGHRLFVCAEDNHSLEVINLETGKPVISIPNLDQPHWVFYYIEKNRIYVATGGDGKVTEFDGDSYKPVKEFDFKEACNNLRFDKISKQLWVGVGKSFGALGVIDLNQDKIIKEIPLSGYLKQFELDNNMVYVNIPQKNQIDVVDIKANKVVATWPVKSAEQNVPMALDTVHRRLFIGCKPGKFEVFSTETGNSVASFNINKETDGIYYDQKRSQIYVSCGEGFIDIIQQTDADHYQNIEKVPTVEGAATSLYSSSLDKLFLAVPQSANQKAEIRIYQPGN